MERVRSIHAETPETRESRQREALWRSFVASAKSAPGMTGLLERVRAAGAAPVHAKRHPIRADEQHTLGDAYRESVISIIEDVRLAAALRYMLSFSSGRRSQELSAWRPVDVLGSERENRLRLDWRIFLQSWHAQDAETFQRHWRMCSEKERDEVRSRLLDDVIQMVN